MHSVYLATLTACTAAAAFLVVWRLAAVSRKAHPGRARLLNEWAWTLIPLIVLAGLLYHSLNVGK